MSDPTPPRSDALRDADTERATRRQPESDIPASPTDGRLGPAADPAEGKRD